MAKTIVVQYATGPAEGCLRIARNHHFRRCMNFGYEYRCLTHGSESPYWEKVRLLAKAARDSLGERHLNLIWMDADVIWVKGDLLPECRLGLVHHWHIEESHDHFNTGVMYFRQPPMEILSTLEKWLDTPDDGHVWHEQWPLNKLIRSGDVQVDEIGYEHNSLQWFPAYRSPEPNVVAWHNYPQAQDAMISYILDHGLDEK